MSDGLTAAPGAPASVEAGWVVRNPGGLTLESLDAAEVRALFRAAGVLLFRGFEVGPLEMKAFAERFSIRFNGNQSRPAVEGTGGAVHHVTEGMGEVEAHCEQANSPFRPDAVWFCCETPAADGGNTLVWDGVRVWEELGADVRAALAGRRLQPDPFGRSGKVLI